MLSGIRNVWFQVFLPRIFERKDLRFLGIRRTLGGMRISGRKAHEVYRLVTWLASLGDCFRSNSYEEVSLQHPSEKLIGPNQDLFPAPMLSLQAKFTRQILSDNR